MLIERLSSEKRVEAEPGFKKRRNLRHVAKWGRMKGGGREKLGVRSVVHTGRDSEQRMRPSAGVWRRAGVNRVETFPQYPSKSVINAKVASHSLPAHMPW